VQVGPTQPFRPPTRAIPAPTGRDPHTRVLALTGALVAHDPPTVVGPVDAPAAADALIDFLVRHGYLDRPPAKPDRPANEAGR
jgi:electron transfer flavoprotein beta subunit